MRVEFSPIVSVGCKPFAVTDDSIVYNESVIILMTDIKDFEIIQSPSPGLFGADGIARLDTVDGNVYMCGYRFKERESFNQIFQKIKSFIISSQDEGCLFFLNAHTGSYIKVYEDYIVINHMRTGGALSNILVGSSKGDKRINIKDITSITLKPPAGVSVGYLQVSYPGYIESAANVVDAMSDENSIPVSFLNLEIAQQIVDFINNKKAELVNQSSITQGAISEADEILKFKKLLDLGVITQEEFETKKKQLLNL